MGNIATKCSTMQNTLCPLCHDATAVKQVAFLYEEAPYRYNSRFAPPTQAPETHFLIVPITFGIIIETVTLIAIMVVCASNTFSLGQYFLSIVGICVPLVWSAYAFWRMVHTEEHSKAQYEWDEAMATWSQLRYCTTDDLVFDPVYQSIPEMAPVPSLALLLPGERVHEDIPVVLHAA